MLNYQAISPLYLNKARTKTPKFRHLEPETAPKAKNKPLKTFVVSAIPDEVAPIGLEPMTLRV